MSELIKLAAELVRLPTEDTPDEVYAGCKTIALKIRDYSDQLTAANAKLAAAERKAESWDILMTMMEGITAAGKQVDGDDRTASRNELCDAYFNVYAELTSKLAAAEAEIERLKAEQSRKDKATIDRLANKIFPRPLEEQ